MAIAQYPWTASGLAAGDHVCSIYETEDEHRQVVSAFLRRALCMGERVLYVTDTHTPEEILSTLSGLREPLETYLKRGQLIFLPSEAYLTPDGRFDPAAVIAKLDEEARRAVEAGFNGLSATGEMTWALRYGVSMEELHTYERMVQQASAGRKWLALCQYPRDAFNTESLQPLLSLHHVNIVGLVGYDHYYYPLARLPMPRTTRVGREAYPVQRH